MNKKKPFGCNTHLAPPFCFSFLLFFWKKRSLSNVINIFLDNILASQTTNVFFWKGKERKSGMLLMVAFICKPMKTYFFHLFLSFSCFSYQLSSKSYLFFYLSFFWCTQARCTQELLKKESHKNTCSWCCVVISTKQTQPQYRTEIVLLCVVFVIFLYLFFHIL